MIRSQDLSGSYAVVPVTADSMHLKNAGTPDWLQVLNSESISVSLSSVNCNTVFLVILAIL